MTMTMETTVTKPATKPLMQRINWVRAAPFLYTLGLFAIWELSVIVFALPQTLLPAPTRRSRPLSPCWSPAGTASCGSRP